MVPTGLSVFIFVRENELWLGGREICGHGLFPVEGDLYQLHRPTFSECRQLQEKRPTKVLTTVIRQGCSLRRVISRQSPVPIPFDLRDFAC